MRTGGHDQSIRDRGARNRPASDGPGDRPRTGRVRRVVIGSLLAGLVLAGVLTMVAFGGAEEPVITGAALLGFGLGWALLAVLSIRMTDHPQRWALVPATAMALTGLGLVVLAPDNRGLTAAGWVWPPFMLALAVWIGLRVRRSLPARGGRWALYPVAVLTAAAAVGGMVTTVALASDDRFDHVPGQTFDVDGHRLHLHCTGSGSPTVVLQSGQGEFSPHWSLIAPAVSRTTRVCAYDRAGQGWSDDAPRAQDGYEAAADLDTLLQAAGEDGQYVVVGHSIGGAHTMAFAARYPEQVAGAVLLDASNLYETPADGVSSGADTLGPVALLPTFGRLGLGYLLPASGAGLPEQAAGDAEAFAASPRGWRNYRDDFATMPALFRQAQQLTTLGSRPLVVLTATGEQQAEGFTDAHDRMASLSTSSSHRFTDATHAGLLDDPRGASVSARAINDVVHAVRTGAPLPPD